MQIRETTEDGAVVVSVTGRVDSTSSAELDDRLVGLTTARVQRVVVDLSGVEYISSAGLRVMLTLARRMRDAGGSLALCGLSDAVHQVFALAGFLPLFTVAATRAEAIGSFGG